MHLFKEFSKRSVTSSCSAVRFLPSTSDIGPLRSTGKLTYRGSPKKGNPQRKFEWLYCVAHQLATSS